MYEKIFESLFIAHFHDNNTKKYLEFFFVRKKIIARTFHINSVYTGMDRFQKELFNFHNFIKKTSQT